VVETYCQAERRRLVASRVGTYILMEREDGEGEVASSSEKGRQHGDEEDGEAVHGHRGEARRAAAAEMGCDRLTTEMWCGDRDVCGSGDGGHDTKA
jgi:hypothetical protein